jgi:hypothetical protein
MYMERYNSLIQAVVMVHMPLTFMDPQLWVFQQHNPITSMASETQYFLKGQDSLSASIT